MKNKITFILSLIFSLMFLNAGLNKFLNYMPVPKDLPEKMQKMGAAFTEIVWLMPLTGIAEIIGGILFIIPKTRALGAIMIFPVMVGILLTNYLATPSVLPISLVLMVINVWMIYKNRQKYLPMIR